MLFAKYQKTIAMPALQSSSDKKWSQIEAKIATTRLQHLGGPSLGSKPLQGISIIAGQDNIKCIRVLIRSQYVLRVHFGRFETCEIRDP